MWRLLRLAFVGAIVLGLVAFVAGWFLARPPTPDAFYAAPMPPSAVPGALLKHEPYARGVPGGARAWRLLHTTTDAAGKPRLSSAVVLASQSLPSGPRPVIAWARGTTGAVPGCAPSVSGQPFRLLPALDELLARGWVLVATDYPGLATEGPHPYLIGEGEARAVLDAVRAARQVDGVSLGPQTVVWGHSQGGHAALWAGIIGPRYASDVPLTGVAALAPASDLLALLEAEHDDPVGRILSSYVARAYADADPGLDFDALMSRWRRGLARDMASRCLHGVKALMVTAEALLAAGPVLVSPPSNGPLADDLRRNTPAGPIAAPLLIAQGQDDDLVRPDLQAAWVRSRCAAGQHLTYWPLVGQTHVSLVEAGSPLNRDIVTWTQARLDGAPLPPGCTEELR